MGADVFMSELNAPDMKENGTRLSSSSSSSSSSSTTFSPYGMDFEKPSSSSSSSSFFYSFIGVFGSKTEETVNFFLLLSRDTTGRSGNSPSVSKVPSKICIFNEEKASSLSDAESKRLAEKLGSRKVETPTDEGGSPTKRKVVKRRVKRKVVSSKDDLAAGGVEEGKNLKKSGAEGDVKE